MPITCGLYKDFSSYEFQKNKTFLVQDIHAVELDLLNFIYTQRGSRVMMPTFGTLIPSLTFEPLDDTTIESIEEELLSVFTFDPRVNLLNMQVVPNYEQHSLLVTALLQYIELNVVQPFNLNITFET